MLLKVTLVQGKVSIEVFFADETLWLTQKLMAQLFEVDRSVTTKHLGNIFAEGELKEKSASAKLGVAIVSRTGENTKARKRW